MEFLTDVCCELYSDPLLALSVYLNALSALMSGDLLTSLAVKNLFLKNDVLILSYPILIACPPEMFSA